MGKNLRSSFAVPLALGKPALWTTDETALNYILRHPDLFPKQKPLRRQLARYLDEGLVVAEGPVHRRQRKQMMTGLSKEKIDGMADKILDVTEALAEKLRRDGSKKEEIDAYKTLLDWR